MSEYAKGQYARLTLRDDHGKRIVRYVQVLSETPDLCMGQRVTRDGDTWERETADAIQREVIAWAPGDVISRTDLALSMWYGTLVEVAA